MNTHSDIATTVAELLSLESQQAGRTVPLGEWDSLHPVVGAIFPVWYRDLMANYPLAGREFDIDEDGCCQGEIHFWEPRFIDYISNEQQLSSFWGVDLTAQNAGFPFCHLPDGEFILARGESIETATVVHFNGISIDASSCLSGSLISFISRLIPSDFEGGFAWQLPSGLNPFG